MNLKLITKSIFPILVILNIVFWITDGFPIKRIPLILLGLFVFWVNYDE